MSGTLSGIKVIEMMGIGPGPFCGMMLADHGAEVTVVDRDSNLGQKALPHAYNNRNKKSVTADLKTPEGVARMRELVRDADALIEGFRPGVMERLGLGPDELLKINPKLVYGRMTGWGQTGPLAKVAGHDINYIALTGALGAMGRKDEPPFPPLNLIGDYGGGGMMLAFGILAALLHAKSTGEGQVVDAAMTDGTAALMSMIYGLKGSGRWQVGQQTNLLDGAAHFYDCYKCADGKFISVGSIEPQFYEILRQKLNLTDSVWDTQHDPSSWPNLKEKLTEIFALKTRDEWCEIMEHTDICFAPVLDMDEAPLHPHNQARETFIPAESGQWQPAPTPRFSKTPGKVVTSAPTPGEHNDEVFSK